MNEKTVDKIMAGSLTGKKQIIGWDWGLFDYIHGAEGIFTILEMCLYTRYDKYNLCCQCL